MYACVRMEHIIVVKHFIRPYQISECPLYGNIIVHLVNI